jgi:Outer membrane protein beta-barrel domain
MKKFIAAFTLAFAFCASSFAQDLHFGMQLSPSWSSLSTDNNHLSGSGSNLGLKLGLIVENRFSQAYSVSTGINLHFNTGGALLADQRTTNVWKDSYENFDAPIPTGADTLNADTKFRYNLGFVEIPVGLKLRTAESGDHLRYFVEPLIAFGFRNSASGTITGTAKFDQSGVKISKEVGDFNMSWGLGAGGEYIISNNTALVVGLYYQSGFIGMLSEDNGALLDATNNKKAISTIRSTINSFTLRLGVMF